MTSVIALPWALEPSAASFPSGQARPEALPPALEVEPALEPGSAEPAGSLPHATRPKVARAARTANDAVRDARRFLVMHVLHKTWGASPGWTLQAGRPPSERKLRRVPFASVAANVRTARVRMDRTR